MDKELQQAVESLNAACWELSKLIPSVTVGVARTGDSMHVSANIIRMEDMNRIPVIPQIRDRKDIFPERYRYKITKWFGGIDFWMLCDAEELLSLVVRPGQEVASDASA